jgi:hypothetical protein
MAASVFTPARSADRVVKHLSKGDDHNSVGLIDPSPDAPMDGPQALYAAEDGSLYLLDQINNRILRLDAKNPGAPAQSLQLPPDVRPSDIVVRNNAIYVWDGTAQTLRPAGRDNDPVRELTRSRSAEQPDDATLSAFAQMGSQTLDSPEQVMGEQTRGVPVRTKPVRQTIASRGRGSVTADVTVGRKFNTAQIDVRAQPLDDPVAKLNLRVRDRIGIVEFLEIDSNGRMYVLTENIPSNSRRPSSAFVVRFSATGVQDSVFDIPLDQTTALSRRFIAISPDGDVYFLRTGKADVDLIGVGSRSVRADAVIENPNLPRFLRETSLDKGPSAAVRPLTRQQVVQTAFGFESFQWRLTPAVYGRDPDTECSGFNRVRRPWYLAGKMNQEVRGVPYCWGCHGSLNQFRANIANGMMAGNVCTQNEPRPDVAGVDCSAFVSATWGLSTHFTTSAIPGITTQLDNAWDLLPGDALNKPGSHVMLFLRFTPDRKVEVMESSTGGCHGRVCRNIYPLSSLLARGYRPVRFRALQDDQMANVSIPDAKMTRGRDDALRQIAEPPQGAAAANPSTANPPNANPPNAKSSNASEPRRRAVRAKSGRASRSAGQGQDEW